MRSSSSGEASPQPRVPVDPAIDHVLGGVGGVVTSSRPSRNWPKIVLVILAVAVLVEVVARAVEACGVDGALAGATIMLAISMAWVVALVHVARTSSPLTIRK